MSGNDIDNIVTQMLENEIHGKLTGAGGDGGCVIGFYIPQGDEELPEGVKNLKENLEKDGYTVYDEILVSLDGLKY